MNDKTQLQGGNPGWAGELGEFSQLTEADVRGSAFFAGRPLAGIAAGGICAYPYQLEQHDPSAPLFEGPYQERLEKILERYPDKQGALIPVLNLAHEVHGLLTPADMDTVARKLDLPPAYVRGVATFYTMYNRRPVGRYFIQVCTNVACNLCGADDVMSALCEATGTEPGQISADGLFTLMEAECLGACGFPTAVQIDDRYYENVSVEDVPRIVTQLRERASARAVVQDLAAVPAEILRTAEIASGNGHRHGPAAPGHTGGGTGNGVP
ncbi:MAG: NAD(P)H-dependent oxidoreductase subunit E [Longimicrobiales bacterium]